MNTTERIAGTGQTESILFFFDPDNPKQKPTDEQIDDLLRQIHFALFNYPLTPLLPKKRTAIREWLAQL